MIVAFRVAAAPALPAERTNVGSCHWHFALLGLSDVHTQTLGLDPGTVSWISHYSDVLVWRSVETYAQRTSGPSEVGFCTADYDRASFRMYFEVLRTFPRDLALRGLAAARQLVDYGLWSLPVVDGGNPLGERLLRNRTTVRTLWLLMWLPLLIVLLAREVRAGLFAILAFAYLCAYPAVQFDPRHFFQLAFLAWVPIGILTALGWRTGARAVAIARSPGRIDWSGTLGLPPAAAWRRAMTILAGGAIALAGAFALASWMQRAAVDRLLEGYLRAAGDVAPVAIREDVDGRVRIGFGGFAPESDRRFGARAMRLVLGGRSCPVGLHTITAGVTGSVVAGPVIRKDHAVRMEPGREVALFLPFYYERAQADRAYVELAAEDVACVLRAEWVDSQQLPSLLGRDGHRDGRPRAEAAGSRAFRIECGGVGVVAGGRSSMETREDTPLGADSPGLEGAAKPEPIYVTRPFLPPLAEFVPYLERIWERRTLTNNGPFHQEFERALADHLGLRHVALFANGTLALVTALQALRITGEVITTPYSFVATAHSLLWNSIRPVFVDIDPETLNLDPERIEAAITPHVTAIMPVHTYGRPCHVDAIQRIADNYNLRVIYDAAHAFGVQDASGSLLSHGDLSVLSFHATKVFTTFEGGAIVCPDAKTKQRIDHLKNFGFVDEVTVVAAGINGKMNEFSAALGLLQLHHMEEALIARKRVDAAYRELLDGVPGVRCLASLPGTVPNYAYFPILVDADHPIGRDGLYQRLRDHGIYARRYFFPLISEFPMYRGLPSASRDNLPVATAVSRQILCLPIYPSLESTAVERIADLIRTGADAGR